MKYCSRGSLCFNTVGQNVLLFDSEFNKLSTVKSGLNSCCRYCQKQDRLKNIEYLMEYDKYRNSQLIRVLEKRTSNANQTERDKPNKKKSTSKGYGNYINIKHVLKIRISFANQRSKKRDKNMINSKQISALLISQNYHCPITNLDLTQNLADLSLDHLTPDELGGKNVIENIVLMHRTINLGKNGDTISDTLDIMLKIAGLTDEQRKQKINEITNRIWDIHQIYPKVYEKISKMSKKQITLLLDSRISVIDLLNTY